MVFRVITNDMDASNGNGQPSYSSYGDTILENRFILHEARDRTIMANLNLRTPTGSTIPGDHQMNFSPHLGRYKDLGFKGISFRGLAGAQLPTNGPDSQRGTSFYQTVALGHTLTPHDVPWFGGLTYYPCVNAVETQGQQSFISWTPGIRTHLGRNWFFLAGYWRFPSTPMLDSASVSISSLSRASQRTSSV